MPRFIVPRKMTSLCRWPHPRSAAIQLGSQRSNERGYLCRRLRERPQPINSTRFTACVNRRRRLEILRRCGKISAARTAAVAHVKPCLPNSIRKLMTDGAAFD
jgi:hypothetical protein